MNRSSATTLISWLSVSANKRIWQGSGSFGKIENQVGHPLWGAPKIHGELLKLGIDVAQSTVSIYMVPRQGRLQSWKIFRRNHVEEIAAIDLFIVATIDQSAFAIRSCVVARSEAARTRTER
jgi:hypothetical protein